MYAERTTIQYVDLTNNNHSTAIEGLSGAVAVAYDMKDNYIYWADMRDHVIMRQKFNTTGKINSVRIHENLRLKITMCFILMPLSINIAQTNLA